MDSIHSNSFNINFNIVCDQNKEIELDVLNIPGNVTVETINEDKFDDFINGLFLTNVKNHIRGNTTIKGVSKNAPV